MPFRLDTKFRCALDLIGLLDPQVVDGLRHSFATSKKFTLMERVVHRDECQLRYDPEAYAHYRMRELRRSIVGRGVPILYKAYLRGKLKWGATGVPRLLGDVAIDLLTDLFVARLVNEMIFPSALAAAGLDVASMRRTFNESLYRSFFNEARMLQESGSLCIASAERVEVWTLVYVRRPPVTRQEPALRRLRSAPPQKPKALPKREGVLSRPRGGSQQLPVTRRMRRGIPSLMPTTRQLGRAGIRLPKASDDPYIFRCRDTGKGIACFEGKTRLSRVQICAWFRDHIPQGSGITCPQRMPNMALVAKTYHLKIPTIGDRAAELHRFKMRNSRGYRIIHKLFSIFGGSGLRGMASAAMHLEALGRR